MFKLADTFNIALPADASLENKSRLVKNACFSYVTPELPSAPQLIHVASDFAGTLGLNEAQTSSPEFLNIVSGNLVYPQTKPYAMCYGGHQFGQWAGQLGDGRAINLFEITHQNQRWALQLKGAGRTPYARNGDGFAVLRSSIREYLCSEAMFYLGVPTTRSLSLVLTGNSVWRDMLYDGNPKAEKGAIVCRVAPSFLRFGNYEIFSARQDIETLKTLCDYTLQQFFPEITLQNAEKYIQFFEIVVQKTMEMVLHWQRIGFVHGVMNTDNMSILGLTIDYGPYGWIDDFDPNWTPNTTDAQHRRYRFGNQPNIALWNLLQLGNALYPLIGAAEPLQAILEEAQTNFPMQYAKMWGQKIGLVKIYAEDISLLSDLEENLQLIPTDMTIFFRNLSNFALNEPTKIDPVCFYQPEAYSGIVKEKWEVWLKKYALRLSKENTTPKERKSNMDAVNPKFVLRNYMAQMAIEAAEKGNYETLTELYELLQNPYIEQPSHEKWFAKRPDWAKNRVGASMLSCSS